MVVLLGAVSAFAQTTAFTYQGLLLDGISGAGGTYQMQFGLFDSVAGGTQIGAPIVDNAVTVANGVFTVTLDFGSSPFAAGANRFLEIGVRKAADPPGFTILVPRQPLTGSPYSIRTISAASADSLSAACLLCVTDVNIGSLDAAKLSSGILPDARLSSNAVLLAANQTLTNKTIDSPTNTVAADKLRTATTTVSVNAAAAPTSGQVLTATGPTAASWQNPSGWTIGGNSLSGTGLFGTTSSNHVDFMTNGNVRGRMTNLGEFYWGATNTAVAGDLFGVVGNATFPWAVNGYSSFNGGGVYGEVPSGTTNFSAIEGAYRGTGNGSGIYGNNQSGGTGAGVTGTYIGNPLAGTTSPTGVYGFSNPTVTGNQRVGVLGDYNDSAHFGIGVVGLALGGVLPGGNLDIGVLGWRTNNANYSGYFNGNHVIANGTKSASVGTSQGNQLLYAVESPEVWFEDLGTGKLVNGQAEIKLDELFLETVLIDDEHPMHVFIQMEDESEDVFVKKGTTSFVVKERNNGRSNAAFSYRVMARRLNFQDHRFGSDPVWGPGDTRPYSQYAPPPPIDYEANLKFQLDQKRSWKPTPLPAGFRYFSNNPVIATRNLGRQ
ncbi:MAG: hypothetical protein JSS81_29850 [Acidobacteria bacterium]|nr:hypothetical protein [Acidobacteriota bacterium]